ncbi:hypothetical protein C8R47DRAFT_225478 [Mycena vitilis]|nr:hypothetical protein C8R47DRAFT_225478 [Mycena vitilis]
MKVEKRFFTSAPPPPPTPIPPSLKRAFPAFGDVPVDTYISQDILPSPYRPQHPNDVAQFLSSGAVTSLTLFRHKTSEHAAVLVFRLRHPAFPGSGLGLKLERVTRADGGLAIWSGDSDEGNLCYDPAADWLTISTRSSCFAPELRRIKRAHRMDKTLTFPAGSEVPSLLDVLAAANLVGKKYPRYSLTDHGGLFYALAVFNVLEGKFNGRVKRGPGFNRARGRAADSEAACLNEYRADSDFEAIVEEFDDAKVEPVNS